VPDSNEHPDKEPKTTDIIKTFLELLSQDEEFKKKSGKHFIVSPNFENPDVSPTTDTVCPFYDPNIPKAKGIIFREKIHR
jgi:hypothetical protein